MDEKKVRKIFNYNEVIINEDDELDSLGWYLTWENFRKEATLDGEFTAEELEAIAWWMKNKYKGD